MAVKDDIVIDQGTTFNHTISITDSSNNPTNLAGYSAVSQMKKWYTSMTSISFNVAINATAGTITINLPPTMTSNIVHGRYVYDVDLIDPANNVTRVVEGLVIVTPGVTNMSIETTANTYNANTDFVSIPLDSWGNTA